MHNSPDQTDPREQLLDLIEQWYVWLTSSPIPLFTEDDITKMHEPVFQLFQTAEWLSQSSIVQTERFLESGSQLVMSRWLKGDYDAYE